MDFQTALRQAQAWMDDIEGVVMVGEGLSNGSPCIEVFVLAPHVKKAAAEIPERLGGHEVIVTQTDPISAQGSIT